MLINMIEILSVLAFMFVGFLARKFTNSSRFQMSEMNGWPKMMETLYFT